MTSLRNLRDLKRHRITQNAQILKHQAEESQPQRVTLGTVLTSGLTPVV